MLLRVTAHRHERAILAHLERLPGLADMVLDGATDRFRERFDVECRFICEQLIPHVQAVETALYPELQRILGRVHSLAPMRLEHRELSRLAVALSRYRAATARGRLGVAQQTGLRRTLYRLYAILKVHLAEEDLFIGVLESGLPRAKRDSLARALRHATAEPL